MPPARFASTLVLLVRHGVTPTTGRLLPGRRRGLHLSEEGRRQAEALAVRLAAVPKLAAIYSSPLERARETVAPRHASAFRFPGGESFVEMQARMVSAVARLVARHRGGTIVVASHADPIKTLVAHALGAPLDLFQRIMIAPASITAIAYRLEGLSVLTMNAMDGDLASLGRP